MIIYLLSLCSIILVLLSLCIYNGDPLSPPVVFSAPFVVSILCTMYNIDRWNVDVKWNTFFVLIGGIGVFVFVSALCKLFFYKKKPCKVNEININPDRYYINVSPWKIYLMMLFTGIVALLYCREIFELVHRLRGSIGWTETMYWFRMYVSYGKEDADISLVINQLFQINEIMGYVCIYIFVHNYVICKKINKLMLLYVVILVSISFLGASRMDLIRYPAAALTVFAILKENFTGKGISFSAKFTLKIMVAFIAFCVIFVFLKQVVGRIDNRDPIYYLTYYIGSSIRNLNVFLQNRHAPPVVWGKETFYGLNHMIYLITNDEKYNYIVHKEFLYNNGESTGNVYTVFRAYINDFGIFGMLVLTALSSLLFNIVFIYLKSRRTCKFSYMLLFYSSMIYSLYTAFYADYFYGSIIAFGIIKMIIVFVFFKIFYINLIIDKKIRKNSRISYTENLLNGRKIL